MQLPTKPRAGGGTPQQARVLLIGHPKVGKSTLAAAWAPDTTLILDTHQGTRLLPGDHYVQPVTSFAEFEAAVSLIVKGDHPFKTIVIDTVDDIYKFADAYAGSKSGKVAAGLIEFGKGTAEAEGLFRREISRLLQAPLGIWFVGHIDDMQVDNKVRFIPKLDKRVRTFIEGSCDYIWFAERTGPRAIVLHTQPTEKYTAGGRTPMPDRIPLAAENPVGNARALYVAMANGLKQQHKPAPAAAPAAVEPNPQNTDQKVAA